MSKKIKSVLSIVLAAFLLLSPLSAFHAKAENEKPYNDITTTYILTGEIKLTDGTSLVFPEEQYTVRQQSYPDGTLVNEEEYYSQMDQLGWSGESHLLTWASENGYNLGGVYVESAWDDENIVSSWYNSSDEEVAYEEIDWDNGEYYFVDRGTKVATYHLYYDASEPIYNYTLNYEWNHYVGSGDLNITFDAPEGTLKELHVYATIDWNEVQLSDDVYTYNGSDRVCFDAEFLDALALGEYCFQFTFITEKLTRYECAYISIVDYTYATDPTELEYTKGTNDIRSFSVNAPNNSLSDIVVEGLDTSGKWSTSYSNDQMEITLDSSLLESLNSGANTLTLVFANGRTSTITINVQENPHTEFYSDTEIRHVLTGEIIKSDGSVITFDGYTHVVPYQAYPDGTIINAAEYQEKQAEANNLDEVFYNWAAEQGYPEREEVEIEPWDYNEENLVYYYYNSNNEEIKADAYNPANGDYMVSRGYVEYIRHYRYKVHSYEVVEGDDSVYVQNNGKGLQFVFDSLPSNLVRVVIDNSTEMSAGDYASYGDLATVNLTPDSDYLKNLSIGDHTITAYFTNGKVTTANFKVVPLGEGGEDTLPHKATEHVCVLSGEIYKLDGTVLKFDEYRWSYTELKDANGNLVDYTATKENENTYWNLTSMLRTWANENGFEGKGDTSETTTTETFSIYFNSKGEVIASENYDYSGPN